MINGLDIYYSRSKPITQKADGLKPISNKQKANGLKPISKGKGCEKIHGNGLKILQ